ncbi:MAG: sigma-70 family RNA polymerase sigma factor [Tannerella sp.]|jgi:RNA polymerase sigma factor (sigma-70 family)|nr:sigma-70 family RNA polymerase sigma factor [Tannerella sp.]
MNDAVFTEIFNTYADELFAYGRSMNFDKETVEDAIQDVFCKVFENDYVLNDVRSIKSYLYRMLKNRLIDIKRTNLSTEDIQDYKNSFYIKATIVDRMISAEDKKAVEARIEQILSVLTDRQREAFYCRFALEMEYEDIGRLLSMTGPAVRKLIVRARKRLNEVHGSASAVCLLQLFFLQWEQIGYLLSLINLQSI